MDIGAVVDHSKSGLTESIRKAPKWLRRPGAFSLSVRKNFSFDNSKKFHCKKKIFCKNFFFLFSGRWKNCQNGRHRRSAWIGARDSPSGWLWSKGQCGTVGAVFELQSTPRILWKQNSNVFEHWTGGMESHPGHFVMSKESFHGLLIFHGGLMNVLSFVDSFRRGPTSELISHARIR